MGSRSACDEVAPQTSAGIDVAHMRRALDLARDAARVGEVPVGAVVVIGDRIVGQAGNAQITLADPSAHAEIRALREAARTLDNYRLPGSTLYSTVEPCLMCYGALLHARVGRLVYAAADPKVSATSWVERMRGAGAGFNHRFETVGGLLAEASAGLLVDFFRGKRTGPDCGEVPKWS